jgi:endo-1,4-beta-D-glucanase Y
MNRRTCLTGTLATCLPRPAKTWAAGSVDPPPDSAVMDWPTFRKRFVTTDGRVVDDGNGGVSHSEGQGYGMLLAVAHGDITTFRRLWNWTRMELAVRPDGLHAWKWAPESGPDGHLADRNNATDGDLLIAWALLRAAKRWQDKACASAAASLAKRIRTDLVIDHDDDSVLLPGASGFRQDGQTVVNLSYWVFPALGELQSIDPDAAWPRLEQAGRRLLRTARFGAWELPPDWLALVPRPRPAPSFAPMFGFNAVRIPLHLLWADMREPELLQPFDRFWRAHAPIPPATVDLASGQLAPFPASPGVVAISRLVHGALDQAPIAPPQRVGAIDYYGAALLLLARLASEEKLSP